MLAEHKRLSYIGIGSGSTILIIGMATGVPWLSILLQLAGIVPFIWGCCQYSMAKGYGWGWGLLGIWWLPGLIILLFFPDRHKSTEARRITEKARPPGISPSVRLVATGLFLIGGTIHEILMWRTVTFDFTTDEFGFRNFQYLMSIEYFLAGGLFVAFLFLRLLRYASSESRSSPLALLVLGGLSGIFATSLTFLAFVVTISVVAVLQVESLKMAIFAILGFPMIMMPLSFFVLHDFGSAFPYAMLYGVLGGGFVVWRVRKRIEWKSPLATLSDLPILSLLFGLTGNWGYGDLDVLGLLLSLTAIGLGLAALVRWKPTGNLYRLSAYWGIVFGINGIWWFLLPYYMFGWNLETGPIPTHEPTLPLSPL